MAVNKLEEIKRRKDDLDVLDDIYRYLKLGAQSILSEDEPLFRWYGIYTQLQAEDGYYMVRIRIPGGDLTPRQLRAIANLSERHGRGLADITVLRDRQIAQAIDENPG